MLIAIGMHDRRLIRFTTAFHLPGYCLAYMDVFTASCRASDRALLNTWYFHLTGRMQDFHVRLGQTH